MSFMVYHSLLCVPATWREILNPWSLIFLLRVSSSSSGFLDPIPNPVNPLYQCKKIIRIQSSRICVSYTSLYADNTVIY